MTIEGIYANRGRSSNQFNGYNKTDKPPKIKLKATKFKVGDNITIKDEDGIDYLEGKIISLVSDMYIEGTILKYSEYIRYPKGTKDVFVMGRDGKRNLNGKNFIVVKCK